MDLSSPSNATGGECGGDHPSLSPKGSMTFEPYKCALGKVK